MMIKVTGVAPMDNYYHNPQHEEQETHKTKFYEPEQNKQTVKDDFGILFDEEMDKLKFNKFI